MSYQTITFEVDDRVAIITLNRPDRLNALSKELQREVSEAIAEADAREDVRVVLVKGAGEKAFSAGYDLKEGDGRKKDLQGYIDQYSQEQGFTWKVWNCSKPTIAAIRGYCLAGGLEFAQCFDIRYCSEDAQFAILETRFGGGIGTLMLPWLIGNRCRDLIFTGDMFDAKEAHRIGIVDRVFPNDELEAQALKAAKRISRAAANCLQWNKRALNQTLEIMGLSAALQNGVHLAAVLRAVGSPERDQFDAIRQKDGLAAALKWRKELFEPFE